jgi:ATP-binding cassette, subfamily B, multidrug efflux pump
MYVNPKRNRNTGNLTWILPYCKPDLLRVAGAVVMFIISSPWR